jgi:hypothetical protein
MAVEDAVVGVLGEYWEDVWTTLDARLRGELATLVDELNQRIGRDGADLLAGRVEKIIESALPAGHPAREVLERAREMEDETAGSWGQLPGVPNALSAHVVRQEARDWLLESSMLTAEQVRAGGEDPDRRFLIKLPARDGQQRLPAFQFGPDGRALDVVLDVNKRLDSDGDPWGVADWWLGGNAWLNATPVDLIGHDDYRVRDAAAALAAEEW